MNLQIAYTSRLIYIYLYIITTLIIAGEEDEEISYTLHVGIPRLLPCNGDCTSRKSLLE